VSGPGGRGAPRFGVARPRLGEAQDERLAIHRDEEEEKVAEAAARRMGALRRLIGPVESEADWQAQLRMVAGHLESMGFRMDRSGGHDAWRLFIGEQEIVREKPT
jgi:hypothetical protein